MNAFKLTREGSTEVIALACGKCGRVYSLGDEYAERCCDKALQERIRAEQWRASQAKSEATEKERVAKAKRVPEAEYAGPVWCDGYGYNDGYFPDTDDFRQWCEDEDRPVPDEVWACYAVRFSLPSLDDLIESRAESGEWHEDITDGLVGTKELQAAITAWNARQTAESWHVDNSTRVVMSGVSLAASIQDKDTDRGEEG